MMWRADGLIWEQGVGAGTGFGDTDHIPSRRIIQTDRRMHGKGYLVLSFKNWLNIIVSHTKFIDIYKVMFCLIKIGIQNATHNKWLLHWKNRNKNYDIFYLFLFSRFISKFEFPIDLKIPTRKAWQIVRFVHIYINCKMYHSQIAHLCSFTAKLLILGGFISQRGMHTNQFMYIIVVTEIGFYTTFPILSKTLWFVFQNILANLGSFTR